MTSGISGDDAVMNHPSEDAVSHILGYGTSNDPGVTFEYSNGNAHLVAAVLQERLTGRYWSMRARSCSIH